MAFRRFIKRILAKILHERLMFEVKRLYYRHAIRSFWESDTEPIKHLVAPGDSVIDIGAHVGWYTFLLANLVGRCGRVYSVEPMPETYALLSSIVRSLHLENVETINCAVSDEDSYAVMEVPFDDSQRPNLYRAR
ncbi:MAG: FkbM family methyltransferase, partial [Candidatus Binatia bacterium]